MNKPFTVNLPVVNEEKSIYGGGFDRDFDKDFLECMSSFIEEYVSIEISPSELNDVLSTLLYANEGGYAAYYDLTQK